MSHKDSGNCADCDKSHHPHHHWDPDCPPYSCLACKPSKINNKKKILFRAYFTRVITPAIIKQVKPLLDASSLTGKQKRQAITAIKVAIRQISTILICNLYDIAVTLKGDLQNAYYTQSILNLRANLITTLIEFRLKQLAIDTCLSIAIKESVVTTWMSLVSAYVRKFLFDNGPC